MDKSKHTIIPVFIPHAGCPNNCVFCNQFSITGINAIENRKEILTKIQSYRMSSGNEGVFELAFFGGSFTAIDKNLMLDLLETAKEAYDRKLISQLRISTRPDCINEEILDILCKYRITTIELGVQSFDDEVLKLSERGHTAEDVYKAVALIKRYNIRLGIQLMPGLPGDTFDKSVFSAKEAVRLMPDCVRIYPTIVFRHTSLEKMYLNGSYTPLTINDAVTITKKMTIIFNNADIFIQRIGLHPVNDKEKENILAGPYDESFGFTVKSSIKRDVLEKSIEKLGKNADDIYIRIPFLLNGEYIGKNRENIMYLSKKFQKIIYFKIDKNIDFPVISYSNIEKMKSEKITGYQVIKYAD